MCGIAGYFTPSIQRFQPAEIYPMITAIRHRGPDGHGEWIDAESGIALGHQRLAIIDLSSAGHQPMISPSGRYVLVFNGEIYNHRFLRQQITNVVWNGHSDTETLLAGFDQWGVESTLTRSVGMFAIALWDRIEKCLYLARDRMGEKPLYYGWQNGVFLFGSELSAIKAHRAFCGQVNRNALALLFRHNYIPAPYSIYQGIFKLQPGSWIQIRSSTWTEDLQQPSVYWSVNSVAERGQRCVFGGSDAEALAALEHKLREAVALQMVADVPLGAFLSGGIDSSTVVALMQSQSDKQVRTFSIGFAEAAYNEAEHAKAVAMHLGTAHTELYVTPQQALDVIQKLPVLYDEPFSDSSQIPTFLVAQMTRQHVTVSLSGDAGDELFGGYNRYVLTASLWSRLRKFPLELRRIVVRLLASVSPLAWDKILGGLGFVLPSHLRFSHPGDKLHKLLDILCAQSPEAIYYGLISHWNDPASVVIGAVEPSTVVTDLKSWADVSGIEHQMMALDAKSYLPDDILVKIDRAAMGVSLETRVPFLDHRVVEFAWSLPLHLKIRNGQGKWILRQLLYKHVPQELIERPKMGFGVPIDGWLRGPLRDWAESLLSESRIRQDGFLNPAPIRQKWIEHLSGRRNWQYHLWDVLMFQAWMDAQK